MAVQTETRIEPLAVPEPVPPLQNGDRLTWDEFERRYDAMPHLKKAELIKGRVYMPSPVLFDDHAEPHAQVILWLGTYLLSTPGLRFGANGTLRLDGENSPQPDAILMIPAALGGQTRVEDGYLRGAPELVAEVAASSVSYDLNDKLDVYRDFGVREYVVWRVRDRAIDWFVLRDGNYESLSPGDDGIYRSEVFPGLWLDIEALLGGDLAAVVAALQQGIATPEHAAFVTRLRDAANRE